MLLARRVGGDLGAMAVWSWCAGAGHVRVRRKPRHDDARRCRYRVLVLHGVGKAAARSESSVIRRSVIFRVMKAKCRLFWREPRLRIAGISDALSEERFGIEQLSGALTQQNAALVDEAAAGRRKVLPLRLAGLIAACIRADAAPRANAA
jgi:hypothetical protein